jgi:CheY-like chemotaxis protein/DNA-binding Xre family transcriptional regulator
MPVTDVKVTFGKAVKKQRSELGISQEELADRAGLHRTYISDIERGARNVSLESIKKLAHALQLSVATLFSRAGNGEHDELVEILLVEDNQHDIELTLHAFRKARIANVVHIVHDGQEALDFVFASGAFLHRQNQPLPGVVLLDLNLPRLDGLEVLRRLRNDKRTRKIPVVVLTVSNADRDIDECRRLGASSYIVKPVGFQNFSEVTPLLSMEWALKKADESSDEDARIYS